MEQRVFERLVGHAPDGSPLLDMSVRLTLPGQPAGWSHPLQLQRLRPDDPKIPGFVPVSGDEALAHLLQAPAAERAGSGIVLPAHLIGIHPQPWPWGITFWTGASVASPNEMPTYLVAGADIIRVEPAPAHPWLEEAHQRAIAHAAAWSGVAWTGS